MNINDLTIGEAKQLADLLNGQGQHTALPNPYIGKRVLVRTYSAGVHIGTLIAAQGMECVLKDALRLWKWEGGGLSLSAIAERGINGGRLNRTAEVYLTNAIEFIPTTDIAEKTYEKFVE